MSIGKLFLTQEIVIPVRPGGLRRRGGGQRAKRRSRRETETLPMRRNDVWDLLLRAAKGVQTEVQFEHIDTRFSEDTELPRRELAGHKLPDSIRADSSRCGDPRHLVTGRLWRNIGIQARAGCRNQIDGDRRTAVLCGDALSDAIGKGFAGGADVRSG